MQKRKSIFALLVTALFAMAFDAVAVNVAKEIVLSARVNGNYVAGASTEATVTLSLVKATVDVKSATIMFALGNEGIVAPGTGSGGGKATATLTDETVSGWAFVPTLANFPTTGIYNPTINVTKTGTNVSVAISSPVGSAALQSTSTEVELGVLHVTLPENVENDMTFQFRVTAAQYFVNGSFSKFDVITPNANTDVTIPVMQGFNFFTNEGASFE